MPLAQHLLYHIVDTTNERNQDMKLTYWKCRHLTDSDALSIRSRTKKEAVAMRNEAPEYYTKPFKVTVEYKDGFELMDECSNEGHHWFESRAEPDPT